MPHKLPTDLLQRLSALMTQQFGLHFPEERWRELERGLIFAAREFDRGDAESCLEWLLSSPLTRERTEILASHLTVGETYFFRDPLAFGALENRLLPDLIESRRANDKRLRLWSAGCSTGEEPYSVAILLHRLLGDEEKDWSLALLATDINLRALRKASEGIYGEWSFRNAPDWLKDRYFRKVGKNLYAILPFIRDMVTFTYHNLVQDPFPSVLNNTNAMDIILCRNVLMYFTPEYAAGALRNFHDCLLDGGWLMTSPVEISAIPSPAFSRTGRSSVALFRKETGSGETLSDSSPVPRMPDWNGPPRFAAEPDSLPSPENGAFFQEWPEEKAPPLPAASRPERGLTEPGAPGNAESLARSAKLCADQGDLAKALDYCQKALALDKLNSEHHYLLASILQEQGSLEEAAAALKRTLYLDPGFVLAHVALAHLAKRRGKAKEARKHAEHALGLLQTYSKEAILPRSEGLTAGRLMVFIQAVDL